MLFDDLMTASFEYGACGPEKYDCFTLSREVLRRAGVNIPDWKSIQDVQLRADEIDTKKADYFIRVEKPEPFSIVTFKGMNNIHSSLVTHIGVVLQDAKTFIHIMQKRNVAIERLDSLTWSKKIDGFYKFNPDSAC